jgi:hypothetical protein
MLPHAAASWIIGRAPRSGMRNGPPRRPKPAKLALNATLRTYVRDRLVGMAGWVASVLVVEIF